MLDSHETHNMHQNLSATPLNITLHDQQNFRLNKINEIKNYFVAEIKERESMSKILSKYIASFDYFDKSLFVLSVTTGSISIASFAITSVSFSLAFSICTRSVKKLLNTTRSKNKKLNKIVMLARRTN